MVGDKTRQHVRRTEGIQPLYSQSNQLRMLHLSRVQSAEIVKFHLSDIGELAEIKDMYKGSSCIGPNSPPFDF